MATRYHHDDGGLVPAGVGEPSRRGGGFISPHARGRAVRLARLPLLVALLVALPLAWPSGAAAETSVVLADWTAGRFAAGAPMPIEEPPLNAVTIAFATDACPRKLLLDLLYAPDAAGADVDGVGGAALRYEFVAQTWHDGALQSSRSIRASGYGTQVGVTDGEGEYELRVFLKTGFDVSWQARVRGWAVAGEIACMDPILLSEVEANPAGTDAGNEWVELHNPGASDVDVSGWLLETTHGATVRLELPSGTTVPAGGRVVVTFREGQALDNADESVRLLDGFGNLRDATSPRSDGENDARTWQRDDAGAWSFATGTPGEPKA